MKKFLLFPVLASLMAFGLLATAQNPCDLSISGFVTDISSNGAGGSIAVEVDGCDSIMSYMWYYNGVEIESFAPLGPEIDAMMDAGNYCVMVYCDVDCVADWCGEVGISNGGCDLEAVVTESGWNDICIEAIGGTPPYAYTWSNGANGVCVDYYENWCVWVTDVEGCLVEMCEETSSNDCELFNLEWTFNYDNDGNIECDGEFFEVTIDFDYENVNTAGFDLSYNGVFYSFNSYNDLPLTISLPAENSWGWLQICDNDNPDCCLSFDFVAPCGETNSDCIDESQIDETMGCAEIWAPVCGCNGVTYSNECEALYYGGVTSWTEGECEQNSDCEIWDVFAEAWECDSLGYFYADITFQSNNTAEQFQIVGNGMNYGTFSYGSPYYTIGPIASNNSSLYEFIIQDLEDSNCSAYTELVVDCYSEGDCEIENVWVELSDCEDGMFDVYFGFSSANTSTYFGVYGNGNDYGTFYYGSSYYELGPFEGNGQTMELVIIDGNTPNNNCTAEVVFVAPDCEETGEIECAASFLMSISWGGTSVVFDNTSEPAFLPMIYSAQYIWSFGDGSTETNYGGPTNYAYADDGMYEVCLTMLIYDMMGNIVCESTTCQIVEIGNGNGVDCEAYFEFENTEGNSFVFYSASTGPIISIYITEFEWDFGDGTTVSGFGPIDYTYDNDGVYVVCLTMWVTDLYTGEVVCESEYCEEIVVGSEEFDCEAYFEAYNDTVAGVVNPLMFAFADMSIPAEAIVSWEWDMGGLGTYIYGDETSQYVIYQYFLEGVYEACLTIVAVANDEECVSTYCTSISTEAVSVEEENWLTETKLYPNPTTGAVMLELSTVSSEKMQIRLLNTLGQVVLEQSVGEGATQRHLLLSTEQLPSGVYTVQIENAVGESAFIRLTKAK